jgi:hypothetical protein
MSGDGYTALQARVFELPMASLMRDLVPALVTDQANNISYFQPAAR